MYKLGIIGINDGNGHPYSFSAIINGFNSEELKKSGWDVIHNYLLKADTADFINNPKFSVTHIWTQDYNQSKLIANACNIKNVVSNFECLVDSDIDAVMILRDDWESHLSLAKPFLDRNKYVFIDKPLSLDISEVDYFLPYMKKGKLLSCSGLMFARELDDIRKRVKYDNEKILFIEASVGADWKKYLIHLIDGILGLSNFNHSDVSVILRKDMMTTIIDTENFPIQLSSRVNFIKQPIKFDIYTNKDSYHICILDNFTAFKRCIYRFTNMICKNEYPFDPSITVNAMNLLNKINEAVKNVK